MEKIEDIICNHCWDVIMGPNKTKGAEFYGINFKQYCSLGCFYEDYKKEEDKAIKARQRADKSSKRSNKARSRKNKTKRNKKKDK